MRQGNYTKKGYFGAVTAARGHRGGHQRLYIERLGADVTPASAGATGGEGTRIRPLCLQAGGGARILSTACLEQEPRKRGAGKPGGKGGYRYAVFVGASMAREVAWSFARHTFDPPPPIGDDPLASWCGPYSASFEGEEARKESAETSGAKDWSRSVFAQVTNAQCK